VHCPGPGEIYTYSMPVEEAQVEARLGIGGVLQERPLSRETLLFWLSLSGVFSSKFTV
jgi:hypothetical protein